jgi:hypothetical protein
LIASELLGGLLRNCVGEVAGVVIPEVDLAGLRLIEAEESLPAESK